MIIPSYGDGWELKSLKSEINNAVGKIKMYSADPHGQGFKKWLRSIGTVPLNSLSILEIELKN